MNSSRKALFLDRDGVINVDHNYVHKIVDCEFIDGIFDLAKAATQKKYSIFVITNQAGIGRGFYTEEDFLEFTKYVEDSFKKNYSEIAKTYFCPYHPEHGIGKYKQESQDRKPNAGMILKAQYEFNIDLKNSVLIGDRETDIEAGINAGIKTKILFNSANIKTNTKADFTINNLLEAIKYL